MNDRPCPQCGGRISVPRRTTMEAVLAVHADTCPAVRRVVKS